MTRNPVRRIAAPLAVLAMILALFAPNTTDAAEHGQGSKTVLITGANRGLGLEFARQYADAGWRVIDGLSAEDTGTFQSWDGTIRAW